MKVIDLLVKIANGEEVPKEIKYNNIDYYWCKQCKTYKRFEDGRKNLYNDFDNLNDEVEIIEEEKKIDKLNILDSGWHNFLNEAENYNLELNGKEYEIVKKINEIIEVINGRD